MKTFTDIFPVPTRLVAAAAAAKSLQSRPTLCDPTDGSPPGSSVHGMFQARVLEWVAIAFSGVNMLLGLYFFCLSRKYAWFVHSSIGQTPVAFFFSMLV